MTERRPHTPYSPAGDGRSRNAASLLCALLVAVAAAFWCHPALLGAIAAGLLALSMWMGSGPVRSWLRLVPFSLLLVLPLLLAGEAVRAGIVLLRMSVAALALGWSLDRTGDAELVAMLRTLRVPALMATLIGFILRYVHVLQDEVRRLQLARRARLGRLRGREQLGAAASVIGVLLMRSAWRSERVYAAMLARGYGRLDEPAPAPAVTGAQAWYLFLTLVLLLLLTVIDRRLGGPTYW